MRSALRNASISDMELMQLEWGIAGLQWKWWASCRTVMWLTWSPSINSSPRCHQARGKEACLYVAHNWALLSIVSVTVVMTSPRNLNMDMLRLQALHFVGTVMNLWVI